MNTNTLIKSLVAGAFAVSAGMGFAADAAKPEAAKAEVKVEAKKVEKKAEHKAEHMEQTAQRADMACQHADQVEHQQNP